MKYIIENQVKEIPESKIFKVVLELIECNKCTRWYFIHENINCVAEKRPNKLSYNFVIKRLK